jgi:hypothetical protein
MGHCALAARASVTAAPYESRVNDNSTHRTPLPVPFGTSKGTGSLTLRGSLTRDSDSLGPRFEGMPGTHGVPFGPESISLETEDTGPAAELAQTVAAKAQTPGGRYLGAGR